MTGLLEHLIRKKILLSDGAMGTELQRLGLEPGVCPESWNLDHPDLVGKVIQSYLDAGSDIVETNTFGGTRYKLQHFGLADKVSSYNYQAAKIAKQLAGPNRYVAGSVGPTGVFLEPVGTETEENVYNAFKDQVVALAAGGADAIYIETFSDLAEAKAALRAVKENTPLPAFVTFTFDKIASGQYRTMMGVRPEQLIELVALGADGIGSNCGHGIENMVEITALLRKQTDAAILIQANAGVPVLENGQTVFKETPDQMASKIPDLISQGANIIGGCCGTTARHIAAMRKKIDSVVH